MNDRKSQVDFPYHLYMHVEKTQLPKTQPKGTCILCGAPLPPRRKSYCSKRCAHRAYDIRMHAQERAEREAEKKAEEDMLRERKARRSYGLTFDEIILGLQETGLSYGEYVAKYDARKGGAEDGTID